MDNVGRYPKAKTADERLDLQWLSTPLITSPGLQIHAIAGRSIILIVKSQIEGDISSKISSILNCPPTLQPNALTHNESSARSCLWFSPNQWLVMIPKEDRNDIIPRLNEIAVDQTIATFDMSGGLNIVRIAGHYATDFLSMGCAVDLREKAFPSSYGSKVRFAHQEVYLMRARDLPVFELVYDGTSSHYFENWLSEAAVEYARP